MTTIPIPQGPLSAAGPEPPGRLHRHVRESLAAKPGSTDDPWMPRRRGPSQSRSSAHPQRGPRGKRSAVHQHRRHAAAAAQRRLDLGPDEVLL